jgi:hypothetical protein
MKNLLQKSYPRYVLLIFYNSINDKTMFNSELRGQGTPTGA